MSEAEVEFGLRPLQPDDSLGAVKGGDPKFAALSQFARKHARKYESENLARTYVIHEVPDGKIVAFITLVCSEVASEDPLVEAEGLAFPYKHYPAVKIARLLVDKRHRGEKNGKGFGRKLVDLALGIARTDICPAIGCRFVVVDSKKDAVGFYLRCGFKLVNTEDNRNRDEPVMFIDLHKAAA